MSKYSKALQRIQTMHDSQETAPAVPSSGSGCQSILKKAGSSEPSLYGGERRISSRHRCFVQGRAVISTADQEAWLGQVTMVNYSDEGLMFELSRYFNFHDYEGQPARVRLRLLIDPNEGREYEVSGTLIRYDLHGKSRVGVRLEEPMPDLGRIFDRVA